MDESLLKVLTWSVDLLSVVGMNQEVSIAASKCFYSSVDGDSVHVTAQYLGDSPNSFGVKLCLDLCLCLIWPVISVHLNKGVPHSLVILGEAGLVAPEISHLPPWISSVEAPFIALIASAHLCPC